MIFNYALGHPVTAYTQHPVTRGGVRRSTIEEEYLDRDRFPSGPSEKKAWNHCPVDDSGERAQKWNKARRQRMTKAIDQVEVQVTESSRSGQAPLEGTCRSGLHAIASETGPDKTVQEGKY